MFGILVTNGERIEEVEIRKKYWKSASEKGAYRSELSGLLGRDTINGFNLGELLGKECIVSIKHIDGESGKFAAIESHPNRTEIKRPRNRNLRRDTKC